MKYLFGSATVALVMGVLLMPVTRSARAADGPGWGTVEGRLVFGGPVPTPAKLDIDKDKDHCLSKGPIFSDKLVVNEKNNGVRWAFVWLAPEKGKKLPVKSSLKAVSKEPVVIDQPCCMFEPHALALREGEVLRVKNSSPIPHNVHWTGNPIKNPGGNILIPSKGTQDIDDLKADRIPVNIKCDIHPWMTAYARVFDHPYYAVTDADGKYVIKDAPAGKFRLVFWQEEVGYVGGKDGIPVEIKAGGETKVEDVKLQPAK